MLNKPSVQSKAEVRVLQVWFLTAICPKSSLPPDIAPHERGTVHQAPLQNPRRNQCSTSGRHSLNQRPPGEAWRLS